jgi:uncharacterized RDD family membrane protein YckC/rRNA maturation endonuclease Nob1
MAVSEPPFDSAQSFCGNCGTAVRPGDSVCPNCGSELDVSIRPTDSTQVPPVDYVPYCRSCGTTVQWTDSHSCQRCGVAPLCSEHFDNETGMCRECIAAQANVGLALETGTPSSGPLAQARPAVACHNCGARLHQGVRYCPQCGSEQAVGLVASASGEVEYMGFWVRCAAFVTDEVIILAVLYLIGMVVGPALIVGFVTYVTYFVGFTARRGQTPGKMLLRIQVVDADGQVPNLRRTWLREALRTVLIASLLLGQTIHPAFGIVFLVGIVGYLWAAWDSRKRGWHDYIGGTFVVRKEQSS